MKTRLLKPIEIDIMFGYPNGRTNRLIRKGKIPIVKLPDGSVRIKQETVDRIVGTETRGVDSHVD